MQICGTLMWSLTLFLISIKMYLFFTLHPNVGRTQKSSRQRRKLLSHKTYREERVLGEKRK